MGAGGDVEVLEESQGREILPILPILVHALAIFTKLLVVIKPRLERNHNALMTSHFEKINNGG